MCQRVRLRPSTIVNHINQELNVEQGGAPSLRMDLISFADHPSLRHKPINALRDLYVLFSLSEFRKNKLG